ncbi:alpha/beta hydrolase [Mycolicibacterium sp. 018/SC-01/001]|uniref:alpha/beta fold hydrolase n=1 Tax=Mycolicibacterium sp. 018/SC-01/001 TaxID=2592069 RepID=UPI00117CB8DC|nr:alpha/beta hydrolase [Mycolicibacterium sp. 018/SC-01/001]TRW84781.1 alpha/beta hydrolase [Mycolicibacterium sp. 018/SC-01/001]
MRTVDTHAGPVQVREEGDPEGPPVVLLHGLLMNDTQWDLVLPHLPGHCRYLLPVLPMGGHRIPMRAEADLTLPGMVDIVADVLDALDLTDVTLVVSDWGGPLHLTAAGRDERIGRLVVCPSEAFDNFPPGWPGRVAWLASRTTGTVALALRQLRVEWFRRQYLVFGMMAKRPVPQPIFTDWTAHALSDKDIRRDLVKYCRTRFDKQQLIAATKQLAAFDRPALILWSDNPVMPVDHARRLAELLPAGRLEMIDDAYVLVMLDQPERTAAALARFLSAEGRPRRADAGIDPNRPAR